MTLESFDFAFNPSINPKRIKSLASCRFMERGEVVFFPACRWRAVGLSIDVLGRLLPARPVRRAASNSSLPTKTAQTSRTNCLS